MTPTAWQLACGLDAWRVTQIPRRPERPQAAGAGDDHRDLLAGQRAAALSAAYHGGAGAVGFAWVRDRAGGPVQVLAAGRGLAVAAGERDAVLKVPAGGRGTAIGPGGLARALGVLPCWVRIAGVADSLLADGSRPGPGRGPTEGPGIRPSLEDGLLAAWKEPFAWLVLAEPADHGELRELTFAAYAAQGAAQRFDNPQAQLAVRRLQDRHTELRQAASAGLWRVHVLAGAAGGAQAAEVAGLLCASADLGGLPYGLVPVPGYGQLDQVLNAPAVPADPPGIQAGPPGAMQPWPAPPPARPRLDADSNPEPASPFYGSTAVLAVLARPPAREIPGSARFVLRLEFDTIPETGNKTETAERGIFLGHLLDRERMRAGALAVPRSSLNRHTFVCGATGAGKSQTVRGLLEQATEAGIPWLVIEPAKAEYSSGMAARLAGAEVIRIRSGEADQAAAGISPLEPAVWADGSRFPLQTHADLVKSLFLAAFEADEPFPQVLNAALTRVYDEHGWDLVLGEPKIPGMTPRYPSLGDLQAAADAVIRDAAYGPEVERNVRGFIAVRLGSLRLGTPGRFFEGGHQLDFTGLPRCSPTARTIRGWSACRTAPVVRRSRRQRRGQPRSSRRVRSAAGRTVRYLRARCGRCVRPSGPPRPTRGSPYGRSWQSWPT